MNKRELHGILKRPIAFHRIFAEVGGGAAEGLFLSQAHYWSDKTLDPDGWFYKTQAEWEAETALTRYEQESVRRELKRRGLLEEKKKGIPAQLFYRVDYDALCAAVDAKLNLEESPGKDGANQPTRMGENHIQECGKAPGKDGAKRQAISTETTSESTQTNGHSNLKSKPNGKHGTGSLEDAALAAFAKLEPRDQKYVREQVKLQGRALHEIMNDLFNSEVHYALRALKSGK